MAYNEKRLNKLIDELTLKVEAPSFIEFSQTELDELQWAKLMIILRDRKQVDALSEREADLILAIHHMETITQNKVERITPPIVNAYPIVNTHIQWRE